VVSQPRNVHTNVHRLLVQSTLVISDLPHSNHIHLATCSLVTAFYELDLQTPDTSSPKSHVLLLHLISLSLCVVAKNTCKSEALRNMPLDSCIFSVYCDVFLRHHKTEAYPLSTVREYLTDISSATLLT
jgi:hypothetical protein